MTEDEPILTEIAEHVLPFGRRVRVLDVDYRNGLHMLRLIWREGKRITQVEIDPENAAAFGADVLQWSKDHGRTGEN